MKIARGFGGRVAKFKAAAAALLAAAVLVTSTGSLAFSNNKLAYAADGTAGICVPETHNLGDDTAVGSMNDTGVATYVGRNFFRYSYPLIKTNSIRLRVLMALMLRKLRV